MYNISKWKKAIMATVIIACMVTLSGCNTFAAIRGMLKNDDVSQTSFDEFVEGLPVEVINSRSMDLNFYFNNPENYGFKEEIAEYPLPSEKSHDEDIVLAKGLLEMLQKYNLTELTETQQLTYHIVKSFFEQVLSMEDHYYLNTSYLGSYLGFQAQLPLLLAEYRFNDKNDIEGYLNLLKTTEAAFIAYADHEQARQNAGVGMSQNILDKVMKQCENFSSKEDPFLEDSFNTRIKELTFLSEDEKAEMMSKNKDLLEQSFLPAYVALKEKLSAIEVKTPEGGLATLPNGIDYYEKSIQAKTGMNMTLEEVRDFLTEMYEVSTNKFLKLMNEKPEALEALESGKLVFSEHTTPQETIDYLEQRVKSDFPDIPQLNYTMSPVPLSMQDNFSPAAYISSRIDSPITQNESMVLNGDYSQSLFSTMMHEAYPGHMYQSVYYKTLNRPAIDSILASKGYAEGWATYVESLCAEYAPMNQDVIALYQANQEASWSIMGLMDLELHADGMSRDEYAEIYCEWLFGGNREACNSQYDLLIEDPGNYLSYFVPGLKLIQMRDETEEALGSSFSLMEFNKLILDCGAIPFDTLDEILADYIGTKPGVSSVASDSTKMAA